MSEANVGAKPLRLQASPSGRLGRSPSNARAKLSPLVRLSLSRFSRLVCEMEDHRSCLLYVVTCKTPRHYYVGITEDLNDRVRRYSTGNASRFVRIHGFSGITVIEQGLTVEEAKRKERELTVKMRAEYGIENVCGGPYTMVLRRENRALS